jgi:hypothetical protein
VAQASAVTNSSGGWSVTLRNGRAVGDDRDEIDVLYSGTGAPTPRHQVILTGNGGNPWTESGWTGWTALDQGVVLTNNDQAPWSTPQTHGGPSLTVTPCFQTGVLHYDINGHPGSQSPTDYCSTAFDTADTPLPGPVTKADRVVVSSNDNRAFMAGDTQLPNQFGGLVQLNVPVGEPDSVTTLPGQGPLTNPFGIPPTSPASCLADLNAQAVSCTGLVPGEHYRITDGTQTKHATADPTGTAQAAMTVHGGDKVSLSNGARKLTALHVANLRIHLDGDGSPTVSSGGCSALSWWGPPLSTPPTSGLAGEPSFVAGGAALSGEVCPKSGSAAGLPAGPGGQVAQTDERSGGSTQTSVAELTGTSPLDGETMVGSFTALAQVTDGSSPVSLKITPASGGHAVAFESNVDTANGSTVKALPAGRYLATWVVSDANGDTRTLTTHFIEQSSGQSSSHGKAKLACQRMSGKARCHVAFAKSAQAHGMVRMRISQGNRVAALGRGRLHNGSATVTMRELHSLSKGTWRVTLVYSSGSTVKTVTQRLTVR